MACLEPQVGNIRLTDGTLIGYRDPTTGVFTPDAAFPDVEFIEDKSCNTSCNYSTYYNGVENIDVPFTYNFSVGQWEPATGPMRLNEDNITFIDDEVFPWHEQDFVWPIHTTAINENDFADRFYQFECASGNAKAVVSIRGGTVNGNVLQVVLIDDTSVSFVSTGASLVDVSGEHFINIIYTQSTSTIDIEVDGVNVFSQVVVIAGGFSLDEYSYGAFPSGANAIEMDFHSAGLIVPSMPEKFGMINVTTRLPTELDANGNKFFDSNEGNEWTLTDRSAFGSYYPYYDKWPTAYLVSDTACTATSGQQQLQLIDGIAQVIDGKFQFILVP